MMIGSDALRLMAKVAHLYYERGLSQTEISTQLDLSQATISRLLKSARKEKIVRISLNLPRGIHPELEDALQTGFGLKEAIVAECGDELRVEREIGAAAAFYVETTLGQDEVVGISSWSATLLEMVDAMHRRARPTHAGVLQILGGLGNPGAEEHATLLTRRLAQTIGGTPYLLPAPGIVGSLEARKIFLEDPFVKQALERFDRITLALVGIGDIQPSRLLATSGNVFSPEELESLREQNAVGDICLQFFDAGGQPVPTHLRERVIGMTLDQLRRVRRCVGIAGGQHKRPAILGALRGGWINVLVTDRHTAQWLTRQVEADAPPTHPTLEREVVP